MMPTLHDLRLVLTGYGYVILAALFCFGVWLVGEAINDCRKWLLACWRSRVTYRTPLAVPPPIVVIRWPVHRFARRAKKGWRGHQPSVVDFEDRRRRQLHAIVSGTSRRVQ